MDQQDVERIARAALKELGVGGSMMAVNADGAPGNWKIDLKASGGPSSLRIRCGPGTTAEWVRSQIVDQYTR